MRAINDKRDIERKELLVAQEKLAETVAQMRQIQSNCDQAKVELANAINMKQGIEKLNEQAEMHIKMLK